MEYEGKDKPSSVTGGVKPIPIEGRFASERERLAGGFTDADRAWRAKYLKDQILHHEPVTPEWFYKERFNPLRRFYRFPLETLLKVDNPEKQWWRYASRYWIGKASLAVAGIYVGFYIVKYHSNDWQNVSGFEWIAQKEFRPKGSPGYNKPENLKGYDYYDKRVGFDKSPV